MESLLKDNQIIRVKKSPAPSKGTDGTTLPKSIKFATAVLLDGKTLMSATPQHYTEVTWLPDRQAYQLVTKLGATVIVHSSNVQYIIE